MLGVGKSSSVHGNITHKSDTELFHFSYSLFRKSQRIENKSVHYLRSEAFMAAEADEISWGYQACQLVKNAGVSGTISLLIILV
jgi:hypothetical protein